MSFFETLLEQPFLQSAVLAGVLASIACGLVGSFVFVKRMGTIAGAISHSVLGGMGIAVFFGASILGGALWSAIVAALILGVVSLRWKSHEDTVIGALWAVGMAIGILFMSKAPGANVDLMSYLFGNILLVSQQNLVLIAVLDLVLVVIVGLFYRQFVAICFDEEFARVRGIPVEAFYLLLLCLVALTSVILIQIVGMILVIALLTLPAAVAALFARTLSQIIFASTLLGMFFTCGGIYLSYGPDLPTGATIIVLAGATYLIALIAQVTRARWSRSN